MFGKTVCGQSLCGNFMSRHYSIWTTESIALLGKMVDSEVANKIGCTVPAVGAKRKSLGIAPFAKNYGPKPPGFWTAERITALGTKSDTALSIEFKTSKKTVREKRVSLGIKPFYEPSNMNPWTEHEIELLGKAVDHDVGIRIGRHRSSVAAMRKQLGIPAFQRQRRPQDDFFFGWENFALLPQHKVFEALKKHYGYIFGSELTYPLLSLESFHSVSRLQKWFTAGSAQQPLGVEKRHHFWLLAMFWGLRSER